MASLSGADTPGLLPEQVTVAAGGLFWTLVTPFCMVARHHYCVYLQR